MMRLLALGTAWGLGLCAASTARAGAVLYVDFTVGANAVPQTAFVGYKVDWHPAKTPVSYEVTSSFTGEKYTLILTDSIDKNEKGDFASGKQRIFGRARTESKMADSADQGFTYVNIYRDLVAMDKMPLMAIEIKGLKPHTPYQVTFYCYDDKQSATDGRTVRFVDFNAPDEQSFGPSQGLMFVGQDEHLTNSKYMISDVSRPSDAQGRLFFVERSTNGPALVNAILIDEAPRSKLPAETAEAPVASDPADIGKRVIQPQQVSTVP